MTSWITEKDKILSRKKSLHLTTYRYKLENLEDMLSEMLYAL